MNLRILASAFDDLADGRDFYERQGEGLGGYFLDALFSDIDSLVLYAGAHAVVRGYHRMIARRFPFAIYYKVERRTVRVRRVLDCRRSPAWTRGQLKS